MCNINVFFDVLFFVDEVDCVLSKVLMIEDVAFIRVAACKIVCLFSSIALIAALRFNRIFMSLDVYIGEEMVNINGVFLLVLSVFMEVLELRSVCMYLTRVLAYVTWSGVEREFGLTLMFVLMSSFIKFM